MDPANSTSPHHRDSMDEPGQAWAPGTMWVEYTQPGLSGSSAWLKSTSAASWGREQELSTCAIAINVPFEEPGPGRPKRPQIFNTTAGFISLKIGLRIWQVPVNLWRNVYGFSDTISQPLVFYLPRQSRPGPAPFEPPSHPLNHFAFSQRAVVKRYLPLRFKLQPWREPCLWRRRPFSHPPGAWAGSGNTRPSMSRPSDPALTGLQRALARWPSGHRKVCQRCACGFHFKQRN